MRQFNFGPFAGTFFGIAFLSYSLWKGAIQVGVLNILYYVMLVVCAVLLLFSILFVMVTFSLRFVRIQGLIQTFWTLMDIGKNPHSIYPAAIRYGFVFLVPAIVIYNFPVNVLSGENFLGVLDSTTTLILGVVLTGIFVSGAVLYFKKSLKYYYD